eukprot:SAG22_NODE_1794_length_3558_cov_2.608557_4_plen_43_part_01
MSLWSWVGGGGGGGAGAAALPSDGGGQSYQGLRGELRSVSAVI